MNENTLANPESVSKPVRIPFDSLTLRAVVSELRNKALGGKVQDIRQPTDTDVQVGIRSRGTNLLLHLSIDALYARTHLATVRAANSPVPTSFCMAARKHLEGATIVDIRQIGFDRVLYIDLSRYGEDGRPVLTRLVSEFMGKHSNIILIRADNTIIESVKRVSDRINRIRQILPGLAYVPPPAPEGAINPFSKGAADHSVRLVVDKTQSDAAELLRKEFIGISPFLSMELAQRIHRNPRKAAALWREVFAAPAPSLESPALAFSEVPYSEVLLSNASVEESTASSSTGSDSAHSDVLSAVEILDDRGMLSAYPISSVQVPYESQTPTPSISLSLEKSFRNRLQRAQFDSRAGQLRGAIGKELKRLLKQRDDSLKGIAESYRADYNQQCGELLLANLWNIQPGVKEVEVEDFYADSGSIRRIVLNPTASPHDNAEIYFRRARKSRESLPIAQERVRAATASIATLITAQEELVRVPRNSELDIDHIDRISSGLLDSGLIQTGEQKENASTDPKQYDFHGHKIRHFVLESGYEVFLGETATANDFLTTRIALPTDLWLHVRASTSSHVVLKTQGHPELVPQETILRAAVLCARHSSQKHSSLVPVDYTLKKYVRKPRRSSPGSVDYIRETTIHVVPSDYDRLL